ncbi:hypothetical protein C8J57DRAFT_1507183 [Mycena rebaudengoi]|nr:hypothetical protein C8J57DRAFT_1507183 [Mycena rebaudengoi]
MAYLLVSVSGAYQTWRWMRGRRAAVYTAECFWSVIYTPTSRLTLDLGSRAYRRAVVRPLRTRGTGCMRTSCPVRAFGVLHAAMLPPHPWRGVLAYSSARGIPTLSPFLLSVVVDSRFNDENTCHPFHRHGGLVHICPLRLPPDSDDANVPLAFDGGARESRLRCVSAVRVVMARVCCWARLQLYPIRGVPTADPVVLFSSPYDLPSSRLRADLVLLCSHAALYICDLAASRRGMAARPRRRGVTRKHTRLTRMARLADSDLWSSAPTRPVLARPAQRILHAVPASTFAALMPTSRRCRTPLQPPRATSPLAAAPLPRPYPPSSPRRTSPCSTTPTICALHGRLSRPPVLRHAVCRTVLFAHTTVTPSAHATPHAHTYTTPSTPAAEHDGSLTCGGHFSHSARAARRVSVRQEMGMGISMYAAEDEPLRTVDSDAPLRTIRDGATTRTIHAFRVGRLAFSAEGTRRHGRERARLCGEPVGARADVRSHWVRDAEGLGARAVTVARGGRHATPPAPLAIVFVPPGSPAGVQDVLVFDPAGGVLSLRRVTLRLKPAVYAAGLPISVSLPAGWRGRGGGANYDALIRRYRLDIGGAKIVVRKEVEVDYSAGAYASSPRAIPTSSSFDERLACALPPPCSPCSPTARPRPSPAPCPSAPRWGSARAAPRDAAPARSPPHAGSAEVSVPRAFDQEEEDFVVRPRGRHVPAGAHGPRGRNGEDSISTPATSAHTLEEAEVGDVVEGGGEA